MEPSDDPIPDPTEVSEQLARMLAGKRLKNAPNPADFLKVVVERALQGKKSTENIIGRQLFGAKFEKDESTDVRVTANNLRKHLEKYYEREGAEDPVIIRLPKPPSDRSIKLPEGESYTPFFRYNPRHDIGRKYAIGRSFMTIRRPEKLALAADYFSQVIELQPKHVAAHIAKAETYCLWAFLFPPAFEGIYSARHYASKAVKLAPSHWQAHAVLGAAQALMCHMDEALASFENALSLNRKRTLEYGWYYVYLMVIEQSEQALALTGSRVKANSEDADLKSLHGLLLYLARRFEEAATILREALLLDHSCWVARVGLILVELARDDPKEALEHAKCLEPAVNRASSNYLFPGLTALCCVEADSRRAHSVLEKAQKMIEAQSDKSWFDDHPSEELLTILLNEFENSKTHNIKGHLPPFIHTHKPWFQDALFRMASDDFESAPFSLMVAWQLSDPLLLFSHLLPIFDELRDQPVFYVILQNRLIPVEQRLPLNLS